MSQAREGGKTSPKKAEKKHGAKRCKALSKRRIHTLTGMLTWESAEVPVADDSGSTRLSMAYLQLDRGTNHSDGGDSEVGDPGPLRVAVRMQFCTAS